jgi:hypothetical protein
MTGLYSKSLVMQYASSGAAHAGAVAAPLTNRQKGKRRAASLSRLRVRVSPQILTEKRL